MSKHGSIGVVNDNDYLDTSGTSEIVRVAESRSRCQLVAGGAEARGNATMPD
jgi:hypothetical protein